MELKLLRKEQGLLEFETQGEDHTLLNIIRETLKDQDGVLFAAYRTNHPILSNPIFYLRTKPEENPILAIQKASTAISDKSKKLIEFLMKK
jgi:DNA-directed RNA polymerase subunit L